MHSKKCYTYRLFCFFFCNDIEPNPTARKKRENKVKLRYYKMCCMMMYNGNKMVALSETLVNHALAVISVMHEDTEIQFVRTLIFEMTFLGAVHKFREAFLSIS